MTCATRWLVVLAVVSVSAQAGEPWLILPPRPGHVVVDQTSTLPSSTLAELDAIGARIDRSGVGQLGVLVLRTTSGVAPRIFATHVFNHWGIGHETRDDGVFVMLALDDRKAELVVGTSDPLSRAVTDAIMQGDIVANMKRNDPAAAVLAAATSIERELSASAGSAPLPAVPVQADERLGPYVRLDRAFPDFTPRHWLIDLSETMSASERAQLEVESAGVYGEGKGRVVLLHVATAASWPTLDDLAETLERQLGASGRPLAIVASNSTNHDAVILLPRRLRTSEWESSKLTEAIDDMRRQDSAAAALELGARFAAQALRTGIPPRPMGEALRAAYERFTSIIWGGFGVFGALGLFVLKRWNRSRSRSCDRCGQPRERLCEDADDQHLSEGRRAEEALGSVDYDVWWCARCNDPLILRYAALFSGHRACIKCGFKTATSTSTTIVQATEHSGGEVQLTTRCNNCSHSSTSTHFTSALPSSTSSSSDWSSSSSSSSYDGGSSSGGGSSGSW
jgi:uncharacterized membrane protein YgcG